MGYYEDRDAIFINDEEKVFFVNTKYATKEFKGFRKITGLNIGEERHETTELKKIGYKKKYVGDFEHLMI